MIWVPEAFIHASLGQTTTTTGDTALEIGILGALGDDGTAQGCWLGGVSSG